MGLNDQAEKIRYAKQMLAEAEPGSEQYEAAREFLEQCAPGELRVR